MKADAAEPRCHEFYFADLDTLVQVRSSDDFVSVHATRDTFSTHRKESFVHELAAEGFIDDEFRWFSFADPFPVRHVRWLVDLSWLAISPGLTASTRRFMLRLLGGAALLWLALMTALLLRSTR